LVEINRDLLHADFLLLILDAVANAHDEALVLSLATYIDYVAGCVRGSGGNPGLPQSTFNL
jgi:hypothetical protein